MTGKVFLLKNIALLKEAKKKSKKKLSLLAGKFSFLKKIWDRKKKVEKKSLLAGKIVLRKKGLHF